MTHSRAVPTSCIAAFVTLVAAFPAHAQQPSAPAAPARRMYLDVPLHVEAPVRPQPFRGDDGRLVLAYHLFLTNWGIADLVLDRLEVLDAERGGQLVVLDTTRLRLPPVLQTPIPDRSTPATLRHIPPGRTAVFRAWIPLDSGGAMPSRISHRFTFAPNSALRVARAQTDTDAVLVLTAATLEVDRAPVPVLFPPLRGGLWRMSGGAGQSGSHVSATALYGRARIAERFAVDFQKVDSAGNILPSPFPDDIENSFFYSNRALVYAVADGVVALIRDAIPENKPTPSGDENMPVPLTRESIAGNQLAIRLANGSYALYAHLVPGSLRVKLGERVKRGQVIAILGNSGNSKNPHLHFEISDFPEINAGQGLPWVFSEFELFGHQDVGGMPKVRAEPARHRNEMPLLDAIVRFGPEPLATRRPD